MADELPIAGLTLDTTGVKAGLADVQSQMDQAGKDMADKAAQIGKAAGAAIGNGVGQGASSSEKAFNDQISYLQQLGRVTDATNSAAVKSWRSQATAQRAAMEAGKANQLQMMTLDKTMRDFDSTVSRSVETQRRQQLQMAATRQEADRMNQVITRQKASQQQQGFWSRLTGGKGEKHPMEGGMMGYGGRGGDLGEVAGAASGLFGSRQVALGINSALSGVMGVAEGYLQFRALKDAITDVYDAATEAQQADLKLDASIKAAGDTAGGTTKHFKDMAQALEGKSLFSREDIEGAESQLLTFKSITGATYDKALQQSADIASKMGESISSSARMIGMALDDPARGMERLRLAGITLTASEQNQVRVAMDMNEKLKAQAIVLEAVARGTTGVAAAMNSGLAGQVHQISDAWTDFEAALGTAPVILNAVIPILDKLANAIRGVTVALGEGSVTDYTKMATESWSKLVGMGGGTAELPAGFTQADMTRLFRVKQGGKRQLDEWDGNVGVAGESVVAKDNLSPHDQALAQALLGSRGSAVPGEDLMARLTGKPATNEQLSPTGVDVVNYMEAVGQVKRADVDQGNQAAAEKRAAAAAKKQVADDLQARQDALAEQLRMRNIAAVREQLRTGGIAASGAGGSQFDQEMTKFRGLGADKGQQEQFASNEARTKVTTETASLTEAMAELEKQVATGLPVNAEFEKSLLYIKEAMAAMSPAAREAIGGLDGVVARFTQMNTAQVGLKDASDAMVKLQEQARLLKSEYQNGPDYDATMDKAILGARNAAAAFRAMAAAEKDAAARAADLQNATTSDATASGLEGLRDSRQNKFVTFANTQARGVESSENKFEANQMFGQDADADPQLIQTLREVDALLRDTTPAGAAARQALAAVGVNIDDFRAKILANQENIIHVRAELDTQGFDHNLDEKIADLKAKMANAHNFTRNTHVGEFDNASTRKVLKNATPEGRGQIEAKEQQTIDLEYEVDQAQKFKDAWVNGLNEIQGKFEDAFGGALAGKAQSIRQFTSQMLAAISQVIAKLVVMKAVEAATGFLGGGTPTLGALPSAGVTASAADLGSGPMAAVTGAAPIAHSGGVVGSSALNSKNVDMSVFAGARRYHTGGLVQGEVPIIAKEGETVLTADQMKARGGTGGVGISLTIPGMDDLVTAMQALNPSKLNKEDGISVAGGANTTGIVPAQLGSLQPSDIMAAARAGIPSEFLRALDPNTFRADAYDQLKNQQMGELSYKVAAGETPSHKFETSQKLAAVSASAGFNPYRNSAGVPQASDYDRDGVFGAAPKAGSIPAPSASVATAAGSQTVHMTNTFTVQALDNRSVADLFSAHAGTIAQTVADQARKSLSFRRELVGARQ